MPRTPRTGYTILEIMVVLAVIVILGAAVLPTIRGYYGNSHQKATADMIQGRIAQARAKAMETGSWYRLSISSDNRRLRLGPDCQTFDSLQAGHPDSPDAMVVEEEFEPGVTASVTSSDSSQASNNWTQMSGSSGGSGGGGSQDPNSQPSSSTGQWTTVMTVGPEGICREGLVTITINEDKYNPIYVQIRGIVASSSIISGDKSKGGGK
jgi:prepilin-type N-terminal cleavage/methylation domain-containing protein